MKIQKKLVEGAGAGGVGVCEWRSEGFVKIKKKKWGGVGSGGRVWGDRVDVNGEVKFL